MLFCITVWMDWRTALVLLACVPFIPASIMAVSRYAKKIFAKYWGKYTAMGDGFLDSVQGLRELKIFRADAAQHARMNARAEEFRKITMKVLVMQLASTTLMDLVAYGGAGVGIAVTVMGVAYRGLSPVAGLFLMLMAAEFFLPLRAFGAAFHVAMNGASAGRKIISLLEQPDPVWGEDAPADMEIRAEHISFSYDGRRRVLQDVSMIFPAQGMTAIVGESGCGKSTVVSLLCGDIRPQAGVVTVGGKPLQTLSREAYYSRLAVVSYNTYLFNETVRANFALANGGATEAEMYDALERVNLAAFIRENGGLDKVISEDASNLSGGQKQRLALAINLVANKDVYIFDEATSNIDIESEAIIMRNIRALAASRSVIVISHRPGKRGRRPTGFTSWRPARSGKAAPMRPSWRWTAAMPGCTPRRSAWKKAIRRRMRHEKPPQAAPPQRGEYHGESHPAAGKPFVYHGACGHQRFRRLRLRHGRNAVRGRRHRQGVGRARCALLRHDWRACHPVRRSARRAALF